MTARLSASDVAIVAAGGAVGTGLRWLISGLVPHSAAIARAGPPLATLGINVVGAFLLGVLLEVLAGRSSNSGWSRRTRLGVGTGGLGGFTTYSALAADGAALASAHPGLAAAYGLGTVVLGAGASFAGIWLARGARRGPGRPGPSSRGPRSWWSSVAGDP